MGFAFRERLNGKLYMLAEPLVERDIRIEIEAHARDFRHPVATVAGRIWADGLAHGDVVQGTLDLEALRDKRIPYDLAFDTDLRLVGEKDLSWLAPVTTFATLPFTIVRGHAEWSEIARGELRFDVRRGWRPLLRSLRVSPL